MTIPIQSFFNTWNTQKNLDFSVFGRIPHSQKVSLKNTCIAGITQWLHPWPPGLWGCQPPHGTAHRCEDPQRVGSELQHREQRQPELIGKTHGNILYRVWDEHTGPQDRGQIKGERRIFERWSFQLFEHPEYGRVRTAIKPLVFKTLWTINLFWSTGCLKHFFYPNFYRPQIQPLSVKISRCSMGLNSPFLFLGLRTII